MAAIIKPVLQPSQALLPKPNYNSPFICDSRKSHSFPARLSSSLSNYKASSRRAASKPVVCATIIDEKRIDGAFSLSSTNRSEVRRISVFVRDESGVVDLICRVFARRECNIESLTVSGNKDKGLFTIVVSGTDRVLQQVIEQLQKLVNVLKVEDFSNEPVIERELMLIKVNADPKFCAEVSGDPGKVAAVQRNSSTVGILEIARTGKRGPVYCAGSVPLLEAADSSIEQVTDPRTDVIIVLQHPSDYNVMQDAIAFLCENDNICCQVMKSYTKKQLSTKLSRSGRKVIIATDHGVGAFLDKIDLLASGSPVIGVPVRASGVTGFPHQFVEMCPKHAILLVPVNDAKGAARQAMIICDMVHPGGRTLKRM